MRAIIAAAVILGMLPCLAEAQELPSLPADSRIKLLPYDESDIYTIPTKYGYQTSIVFAAGEVIDTISVGDRTLWQIIPSGNRLFIRPMQESVTTNMTVLTDKRSYQFDLTSVGIEDKNTDIVYVAKFVYPDPRRAAPPAFVPPPMAQPPMMPPPPMQPSMPPPMQSSMAPTPIIPSPPPMAAPAPPAPNYNYTYSGPDTLAPLQVFDNGKATFIKYNALPSPLPEVYMLDQSGQPRPVAHSAQDSLLIVHAIAPTLALKSEGGEILVYNETLNPQ